MPDEDASPSEVAVLRTPLTRGNPPPAILLASVLAWLGALVSLLLLKKHAALREFLCPAQAACETVLKSRYASVSGIPLSLAGGVFYLVILGLLLLVCGTATRATRLRLIEGIHWLVVVGVTFSVGLMYLQFGVLHAFCPLCTLSAFLMGGLLVATARVKHVTTAEDWGASRPVAMSLGIFAVFPAAILMASGLAAEKPSVWIDLSTAHLAGPTDARVQLAVYSDFQCPFCRLLAPTLKRLRGQFPQEVLLVFRPFPVDGHPRAFPAAVAAEAAAEQGKFWEYHDALFTEGEDLSDARLDALAAALGLDPGRFAEARQSERCRKRVEASRRDAMAQGVEGVPTLFLNGRQIEDGLDYDHLVQRIQKLLPANPQGSSPAESKVSPAQSTDAK